MRRKLYNEGVCQGSTCRGWHSLYGVFGQQHLWSQEMVFAHLPWLSLVLGEAVMWPVVKASCVKEKSLGPWSICMACVARTSRASYQGYHTIP